MKRQLIYHTHVNTRQSNQIKVFLHSNTTKSVCSLDRISRDGLTLSCDFVTLQTLMPNKSCIEPKNPISFEASFKLDNLIEAKCRIIFARRLAKDKFVLELKFVDISEKGMHQLDSFIEKALHSEVKKADIDNNQGMTKPISSSILGFSTQTKETYQKVA